MIPVSPERCPSIKYQAAVAFRDWLVSATARYIAAFQKDGSQLSSRTPNNGAAPLALP